MEDNPVQTALDIFGERIVRLSKINLTTGKSNSTNKLRNSIKYNLDVHKNSFHFDIEMEDYGEWVDEGREAGTWSPPLAILKWIHQKPIRLRDKKTGEFLKQTTSNLAGLAYVINRKIFEKGIEPTNFLSDPFKKEFKKLPEQLAEAYALNVADFLESSLIELNKSYDSIKRKSKN